jgi:hypothetical protein
VQGEPETHTRGIASFQSARHNMLTLRMYEQKIPAKNHTKSASTTKKSAVTMVDKTLEIMPVVVVPSTLSSSFSCNFISRASANKRARGSLSLFLVKLAGELSRAVVVRAAVASTFREDDDDAALIREAATPALLELPLPPVLTKSCTSRMGISTIFSRRRVFGGGGNDEDTESELGDAITSRVSRESPATAVTPLDDALSLRTVAVSPLPTMSFMSRLSLSSNGTSSVDSTRSVSSARLVRRRRVRCLILGDDSLLFVTATGSVFWDSDDAVGLSMNRVKEYGRFDVTAGRWSRKRVTGRWFRWVRIIAGRIDGPLALRSRSGSCMENDVIGMLQHIETNNGSIHLLTICDMEERAAGKARVVGIVSRIQWGSSAWCKFLQWIGIPVHIAIDTSSLN